MTISALRSRSVRPVVIASQLLIFRGQRIDLRLRPALLRSQTFRDSGLAFLAPLGQMRRVQAMLPKHGADLAGPLAASASARTFCLYSPVCASFRARQNLRIRGAARPPSTSSIPESNAPVTSAAGRAEPFIVAMLILFPALLTNCGHTRCLSHVGTEGNTRPSFCCIR